MSLISHTLAAPVFGSRGRNGYFTARSVDVFVLLAEDGACPHDPSLVAISARSLREAKDAPARIALSLEDALVLAEQITEQVRLALAGANSPKKVAVT